MENHTVMTRDRHLIVRKKAQLAKRQKDGLPSDRMVNELNGVIEKSSALYQARMARADEIGC